jgi:hypothetical protein
VDSELDNVERLMAREEKFAIEIPEGESGEWWRRLDDYGLQGSGIPRRGPFPTGEGGAETPLPRDDAESS